MTHSRPALAVIIVSIVLERAPSRLTAQTVPPGYRIDAVVTGLSSPTTMAFLGANDFFVTQKSIGKVRHVQFGGASPIISDVLTLSVYGTSEQGMLGIALAQDFTSSGTVFLFYSNGTPHENRVARYHWDGVALVDPVVLATLSGNSTIHNGGVLAVGLDGMLYALIGEQLQTGRTQNNTASTTVTETGSVLRMQPDDGAAPADNPFVALPGWERIYAYGIRNCFGMAIDPLTGALWTTEVAPSNYGEVNHVVPGMNSGWSKIMGPDSRDPQNVSDLVMNPGAVYVDPAFSWYFDVVPTGISFLHSVRWPASIRDKCVVASYGTGQISLFELNAARDGFVLTGDLADGVADSTAERAEVVWASAISSPTDLEMGPDGYLYVVSINSGNVYRIRPVYPIGDVNRDGSVDGADVGLFVNLLTGASSDPLQIAQSDFDGSGAVDAADLPMFIESELLPN